jgi:hypothetical protein
MYQLWSSSICSLLHPPVTSSLFDPNSFMSKLFLNTLSLCPSLNVRDQVSHPYKRGRKIYFFIMKISNLCNTGKLL